jgi:hypothetical protein
MSGAGGAVAEAGETQGTSLLVQGQRIDGPGCSGPQAPRRGQPQAHDAARPQGPRRGRAPRHRDDRVARNPRGRGEG